MTEQEFLSYPTGSVMLLAIVLTCRFHTSAWHIHSTGIKYSVFLKEVRTQKKLGLFHARLFRQSIPQSHASIHYRIYRFILYQPYRHNRHIVIHQNGVYQFFQRSKFKPCFISSEYHVIGTMTTRYRVECEFNCICNGTKVLDKLGIL